MRNETNKKQQIIFYHFNSFETAFETFDKISKLKHPMIFL